MLTKEEFCKYVNTYKEFQDYIDKLDKLNIKLWETEVVGRYIDNYVTMVSKLMDCAPDEKNGTVVENFLFNYEYENRDLEEFYDEVSRDQAIESLMKLI